MQTDSVVRTETVSRTIINRSHISFWANESFALHLIQLIETMSTAIYLVLTSRSSLHQADAYISVISIESAPRDDPKYFGANVFWFDASPIYINNTRIVAASLQSHHTILCAFASDAIVYNVALLWRDQSLVATAETANGKNTILFVIVVAEA